jgi:hypothetical protein
MEVRRRGLTRECIPEFARRLGDDGAIGINSIEQHVTDGCCHLAYYAIGCCTQTCHYVSSTVPTEQSSVHSRISDTLPCTAEGHAGPEGRGGIDSSTFSLTPVLRLGRVFNATPRPLHHPVNIRYSLYWKLGAGASNSC